MRVRWKAAVTAMAVALPVTLSGCSSTVEQAAGQAVEQVIEQQADVDVEAEGDGDVTISGEDGSVQVGSSITLPEDFPRDLPIPEGTLVAVVSANGGWSLSYEGVEQAAVEHLVSRYDEAGYQEVFAAAQDQTLQSSHQNSDWTVMLLWDGSGESKALVYSVTPN